MLVSHLTTRAQHSSTTRRTHPATNGMLLRAATLTTAHNIQRRIAYSREPQLSNPSKRFAHASLTNIPKDATAPLSLDIPQSDMLPRASEPTQAQRSHESNCSQRLQSSYDAVPSYALTRAVCPREQDEQDKHPQMHCSPEPSHSLE